MTNSSFTQFSLLHSSISNIAQITGKKNIAAASRELEEEEAEEQQLSQRPNVAIRKKMSTSLADKSEKRPLDVFFRSTSSADEGKCLFHSLWLKLNFIYHFASQSLPFNLIWH